MVKVNAEDSSLVQTSMSNAFLNKQRVIENAKAAINELAQLASSSNSTDPNSGEQV